MILCAVYPQIQLLRDLAVKRQVQVFLVGGFLRDFFLGRPCEDFDFAVHSGAVPLARDFARKIRGAFVLLDEEHGCARVVKKDKDRTLTFDFADFRAADLRRDLMHRDFTINTLTVPVHDLCPDTALEAAVEDHRKARADIRARRIRMNSVKVFREDPLRVLRAFSLRAALGFHIERQTLERIKADKDRLPEVSYERIRDELFKILRAGSAGAVLKEMDRLKILEVILPQIRVMDRVKQGGYHHLDVWPHSLETVSQLDAVLEECREDAELGPYLAECVGGDRPRLALMKLAGLLHDIGKPESRRQTEGRVFFHGHERVGQDIVRHMARMFKLSTRERRALTDMVLWHLRPGYLSNFKQPSARAVFRYLRDTGPEAASIALLSLADQRSTRGPLTSEADQKHHERICRLLVREYFERQRRVPFQRLLDGHDLIRSLKLKPSPLFARILQAVEEQQVLGRVQTKEDALSLAAKLAGMPANKKEGARDQNKKYGC